MRSSSPSAVTSPLIFTLTVPEGSTRNDSGSFFTP